MIAHSAIFTTLFYSQNHAFQAFPSLWGVFFGKNYFIFVQIGAEGEGKKKHVFPPMALFLFLLVVATSLSAAAATAALPPLNTGGQ